MALMNCPDCRRPVSTEAIHCPACGRPLSDPPPLILETRGTQTIQATAKVWKLFQLLGGLGFLAGAAWTVRSILSAQPGDTFGWAIGLGVCSLALLLLGRLAAWWFHG